MIISFICGEKSILDIHLYLFKYKKIYQKNAKLLPTFV